MEPLRSGDPRRISSYEILNRLGAGGMGQVYLGRSPSGRRVAVKVIRPELTNDPTFRQRFRREVTAMRQVSGFFTAPVVDADPDGDPAWLATAFVPGPSLESAVADGGAMPHQDVLLLAAGLAEALNAIHREGLTHRDLKPGNVLMADDGPRVIDFGLAVTAESAGAGLTQAGTVVGTPAFMSPEQVTGKQVGPASDVWSLGAVLAYAATGNAPFGDGGTMETMLKVMNGEPDLSGLTGTLAQLVSACMMKDPYARPTPARILQVLSEGAGVEATMAMEVQPPVASGEGGTGGASGEGGASQVEAPVVAEPEVAAEADSGAAAAVGSATGSVVGSAAVEAVATPSAEVQAPVPAASAEPAWPTIGAAAKAGQAQTPATPPTTAPAPAWGSAQAPTSNPPSPAWGSPQAPTSNPQSPAWGSPQVPTSNPQSPAWGSPQVPTSNPQSPAWGSPQVPTSNPQSPAWGSPQVADPNSGSNPAVPSQPTAPIWGSGAVTPPQPPQSAPSTGPAWGAPSAPAPGPMSGPSTPPHATPAMPSMPNMPSNQWQQSGQGQSPTYQPAPPTQAGPAAGPWIQPQPSSPYGVPMPFQEPVKKNRNGLIIAAGVAAVVVIGGVIAIAASGGSGGSSGGTSGGTTGGTLGGTGGIGSVTPIAAGFPLDSLVTDADAAQFLRTTPTASAPTSDTTDDPATFDKSWLVDSASTELRVQAWNYKSDSHQASLDFVSHTSPLATEAPFKDEGALGNSDKTEIEVNTDQSSGLQHCKVEILRGGLDVTITFVESGSAASAQTDVQNLAKVVAGRLPAK